MIKQFDDLTGQEVYQILKLRQDVFILEQACFYEDMDNKDQVAHHLCIYEEGQVMAYLRILPPGLSYDEVSIGRVLVHQAARHKGYGRKMMMEAMDYISQVMKESAIRISAQAYLEDFYSSLGFVRASEDYLEDDILHLEMLYRLASFKKI